MPGKPVKWKKVYDVREKCNILHFRAAVLVAPSTDYATEELRAAFFATGGDSHSNLLQAGKRGMRSVGDPFGFRVVELGLACNSLCQSLARFVELVGKSFGLLLFAAAIHVLTSSWSRSRTALPRCGCRC